MLSTLRKLRGRSWPELTSRGVQVLHARVERLGIFARTPSADAVQWAVQEAARRGAATPLAIGPEVASAAVRMDPEARDHWARVSSLLTRGELALLGLGVVETGNPPDWHRDSTSGRRARRVHWSAVDYLNVQAVGDHKALWEPNRHQYLLAAALDWSATGNRTSLELIFSHLESWLEENPFRVGINWASSLEVAYRAISWCWLLRIVPGSKWPPALLRRLVLGVDQHARHVERYLSTYFSPNTHLTGEALGLVYAGTAVACAPGAARWRRLGTSILERWLPLQVMADGTYFEQATQYHRYTAEIYLHFFCLSRSNGLRVGADVRPALSRLFDVLRSLADARGRIPLIGDDDGGALLPLDSRPPDDVRSLLLAGAVALDRPELAFPGASPLMATALCGYAATMRMVDRAVDPAWRDRAFVDGGLYVLRDGWHSPAAVAVVDAGVHGAMNCGHAHADALAMTLTLGERPLFVDRGTFTYTGPERNEFRSTCSHNTVEIDGESSAEPGTAFAWRSIPPAPEAKAGASGELRWLSAVSQGHVGSPRPSVHRRVVLGWRGGPWVVMDRVSRPGLRKAVARWYLAPDITPVMERADVVDVVTDSTVPALASVAFPCSPTVELENRDVSFRLGGRTPSKVIAARADTSGRVVTLVAGPAAQWVSNHLAGGPEATWVCASGGWRHTVIVRPEGLPTWCPFGVDSDAELAWCIEPQGADERGSARLCLVAPREGTVRGAEREERDRVPFGVTVLERAAGGWRALPNEEFGRSATE